MVKYLYIVLVLGCLLNYSCDKKGSSTPPSTANLEPKLDSLQQREVRNLSELLSPESRKLIAPWTSYQQLDELIDKFYTYTVQEVLFSASELAKATQYAKDSIPIIRLKEIDVRTRLDVLNNSALRLKDMATIPSISVNEVNQETQQMIDAFGALNSKINNITRQQVLELELRDLEKQIDKKNLGK